MSSPESSFCWVWNIFWLCALTATFLMLCNCSSFIKSWWNTYLLRKGLKLLPSHDDDNDGVIVEMKEPMKPDMFLTVLRASMSQWKEQRKKGVWINLPIELASLVETAVKEGFKYHHAEPSYLMLVYWIPDTPSTIPANASHRVSVGAIVLNDKKEILVVQEKSGNFRGPGAWKIPTGVVDEGENIFEAVVREVKEETGIDTEFQEILAFRQTHKYFFRKSDLFFLCMLRPLSFDIQMQEQEIEAAQWIPFEEYIAQPIARNHELFRFIADLCLAKVERDYSGFPYLPITFKGDKQYLYSSIRDKQQLKFCNHH